MQNKNNWFSDAIYLDHVTELIKSNQRGEGLNKDWDPGPIAQGAMDGVRAVGNAFASDAGKHLLPAAVVAGGMGLAKLAGAAKRGAKKLIDHGTEELRPDEKGVTPPGYAPPSKTERGKANRPPNTRPSSEKPITRRPVPKPLAASMSGKEASPLKKSFFSFAVYPEEVGRQEEYSLRKSERTQEPEYVETPGRQPLAKPNFFESTILPHEAGRADHYLRKGIVPLDRFGFRKAGEEWDHEDSEADAARDRAIAAGTYGPDGDMSRSKPAWVPPKRSAPAQDDRDPDTAAADHFLEMLEHAKIQNNSTDRAKRAAAAGGVGDAMFKLKKLLPHMTKQHIGALITAMKSGDMDAIEDIRNELGIAYPDPVAE